MRLHRGLALVLVGLSAAYLSFAPWTAVGHGPTVSAYEALRRYNSALAHGRTGLATSLGEQAFALADANSHWTDAQKADLAAQIARTAMSAGRMETAVRLTRVASQKLEASGAQAEPELSLVARVARAQIDIALAAGAKLDAACAAGLLLEQLGPERLTHPEAMLRPNPELLELSEYLSGLSAAFDEQREPRVAAKSAPPLTSCNLLSKYYADHKQYTAAASVSRTVLAEIGQRTDLSPELRAALLQEGARIEELQGDVKAAESRLNAAVAVLEPSANSRARVNALESLGLFLSNWGESARALPVLQRAVNLRDTARRAEHGRVAPALVAIGYAQLDAGDAKSAESSFRRALGLATAKGTGDDAAAFDACVALAELAEDQNRSLDAAAWRKQAQEYAPNEDEPYDTAMHASVLRPSESAVRALSLTIPFHAAGEPAGGPAREAFSRPSPASAQGEIEVLLSAAPSESFAAKWPDTKFVHASRFKLSGWTGAPKLALKSDALRDATVLFIPAEGTTLTESAQRAAKLQAFLGNGYRVAFVQWGAQPAIRGALFDAMSEQIGRHEIANAIRALGANRPDAKLSVIAEGRGARLLGDVMSADATTASHVRSLTLIAPEVTKEEITRLLSHFDGKPARATVYAAPTASSLGIVREVYGLASVGASAQPVAAFAGTEWIEIGVGKPWADFQTLASDALLADLSSTLILARPARERCGVAQVNEGTNGPAYVLNPNGCSAPLAEAPKASSISPKSKPVGARSTR